MFNVFRGVERSPGSNPRAVPTDDSLSKGGSINNSHMQWPSVVCGVTRRLQNCCPCSRGGAGDTLGVSTGESIGERRREKGRKKKNRVRKIHEK